MQSLSFLDLIHAILPETEVLCKVTTAWKLSKYRVIPGPYLDTFYAVCIYNVTFIILFHTPLFI